MSAIGELAGGIAHEIRNPLGAISMTVQRLGREFQPVDQKAEQKRLLDIIRKEIEHISTSIKNLLQFSKPTPLQKSRNRLDLTIDQIIDLYQKKAAEASIDLRRTDRNEIEAYFDPEKISECIVNILENAIAATPPKGYIEIGLRRNKQTTMITVKDSGHGIAENDLPKIFNLYFTTKATGTGFGLAQAQQIISEHGGKIDVSSQKDQGTIFTITLPGINAA